MTDLVADEQASGIAQINKGIEQVAQVVQNNSATAEESAAASEELSSQAELLKEMVSRFKLRKEEKYLSGKSTLFLEEKRNNDSTASNSYGSNPNIMMDFDMDKY